MADLWLSSVNGSDSNNGSSKALAKASWDGASGLETVIAASDFARVDRAHSESYSSTWTMASPGGRTTDITLVAMNWSTDGYQKSTIDNFSATGTVDILITGSLTSIGLNYAVADDLNITVANTTFRFVDCKITLNGAGSVVSHGHATGGCRLEFWDVELDFTSGGDGINQAASGDLFWKGGLITFAGTQPTVLLSCSSRQGSYELIGVDLSAISSTLLGQDTNGNQTARFVNCILHASVTLHQTIQNPSTVFEFIACDDTTGNSLIRYYRATYYGAIYEDTGIYLSSVDGDGTTDYSLKMVDNGNTTPWDKPLESAWIQVWISSSGSKTIKIPIVHDSATNLQDDEVWLRLAYMDSSADPQLSFTDDRTADILATPSDQGSSTETWTGTGGFTNENKQELSVTATFGRAGYCYLQICLAAGASKTIYASIKAQVS